MPEPLPAPPTPPNYGDVPYDAGQRPFPNLTGWFKNAVGQIGQGASNVARTNPWGVAPTLDDGLVGGRGPLMTANNAPPPLPVPGSWNSSMSSMTGAPLTPNNTGLPYPAIPPSTNFGDPNVAQWEAGMNLINAQTNQLSARRALEAKQPLKWTAQGNVLDARSRALDSQSAYLDQQAMDNAMSEQETRAIIAARNDPKNVLAVARAQRERDVSDYRYRIAGLPTPIEVTMPDGAQGPLPPGVRARLETIADKLTRQSEDSAKLRKFRLEAARIATTARGQEVTAAEIAAGRVSLSLEQAEQALRLAGLDVDQAQLAAGATKMPPAPGLTWDDEGNRWVNATDLNDIKRRRENQSNEYAGFSISELIQLLNGDKLDPNTFRNILTDPNGRYGYLDSTVDHLLDLAAVQKARSTTGIDTSIFQTQANIPPPQTGSGAAPQTTAQSTNPTSVADYLGGQFRPR